MALLPPSWGKVGMGGRSQEASDRALRHSFTPTLALPHSGGGDSTPSIASSYGKPPPQRGEGPRGWRSPARTLTPALSQGERVWKVLWQKGLSLSLALMGVSLGCRCVGRSTPQHQVCLVCLGQEQRVTFPCFQEQQGSLGPPGRCAPFQPGGSHRALLHPGTHRRGGVGMRCTTS